MNPEETPTPQVPAVAPVAPEGQLPVAQPAIPEMPVVPPTLETPKPKSKKMFLVFGVILLLVVLFAVGVFAFTVMQKPVEERFAEPTATPSEVVQEDPTKDWKTYSNTEFGVSFKYPPAAFDELGNRVSVDFEVIEEYGTFKFLAATGYPLVVKKINVTPQEYLSSVKEHFESVSELTKKDVLGVSALSAFGVRDLGSVEFIFFEMNDLPVVVEIDKDNGMGYQILSTFEFIDESTNDWETYTDQVYYYTVKHPKSVIVDPTPSVSGVATFRGELNDKSILLEIGSSAFYSPVSSPLEKETVFLGGRETTREVYKLIDGHSHDYGVIYLFTDEGRGVFAESYTDDPNDSEMNDLYSQILSTFEFTD